MPSDPYLYSYPSPIAPYKGQDLEPLSQDRNEDGKSFKNPTPTSKSEAYSQFVAPITNGIRGGFDIHVYYNHTDESQFTFAKELWERIRREFPELRIYRLWEGPLGPHPVAMFEVNLFTPGELMCLGLRNCARVLRQK